MTLDDVGDLDAIVDSLKSLSHRTMARIVFDSGVDPAYYVPAVARIKPVADIMGEILDSFAVKGISVSGYLDRTRSYVDQFGDGVSLWEVGNEINGEWLGETSSVVQKMTGAYDLVKSRGGSTALTLYFNQDCWAQADHEMFTWAQANVPSRMKSGLDRVWISYYEDDCNDLQPDWNPVFQRLARMFPNSQVGFGETGTKYSDRKRSYLTRYYQMKVNAPRYVGGYFWWYFHQDMVPGGGSLWQTLDLMMKGGAP